MLNLNPQVHEKIRNDPDYFFEKWLGVNLWEKERELLQSVKTFRKTTVRSCHSSGKTFTVARIALWFLYGFPPAVVIDTAPTDRQVRNQFWREFRAAHQRALRPLGGELLKTQFNIDEDWYAFGFSTRETVGEGVADKFQGFHGKNILFIVDEASGVSPAIFEAIDGCLASGCVVRLIYVGNPTCNEGRFTEAFKDSSFNPIHISAFDIPNVKEKKVIIPGLATWEWVEEMKKKYGEDSDVYKIKVLGEFPSKSSDTVISVDLVEKAIDAEREIFGEEEILGVDPARYGDDSTAIIWRKGNRARVVEKIQGQDTMRIAGLIKNYLTKDFEKAKTHIDIIGLGVGIFDRLREQPEVADRVCGVNTAKDAQEKEDYKNLRAEGWHVAKEWLKTAILEKHEDWYQLAKPKYKILSSGQIQLESKEDMKKRGVSSPDVADALVLTLLPPTEGGTLEVAWI